MALAGGGLEPRVDDAGAAVGTTSPGAAYVCVKPPSGRWQDAAETAKLTSSDGAPDDALGSSVAVSGDTIVAGAPVWAGSSNASPGAAYVFVKSSSGGWANATQAAELTASDGAAGDHLGYSVAAAGDTVAAVAPNAAVGANSSHGAVYVFVESASGGWANATQNAKFTASDGAADDQLGWSVAVSGDMIVAGAPLAHVGAGSDRGAAYVFADATAPGVVITTPADGGTYGLGQDVAADFACLDEPGGSGISSCEGPVADGGAIDTSSLGSHDFTVTAVDEAGNRASRTVHYTVRAVATPTPMPTGCPAGTSPSVRCAPDPHGSGLRMFGTDASETLVGTSADDRIFGGGGDDRLRGRDGDDLLGGNAGDDTLVGGSGDDTVFGGDGDDRLFGSSGADRVSGRAGDDRARGGRGDDRLFGGAGADALNGDKDGDHVSGGAGEDRLRGGQGDDRLLGGSGDDRLRGDNGGDHLRGNAGDDQLRGGEDDDVLRGGKDDDRLHGDRGSDDVRGDRGHDHPEAPLTG